MDHLGPWLVVAVVAIGWGVRAVRNVSRFAADFQAAAADPAAQARAAELARPGELARGRAIAAPAPVGQPAPGARPTPGSSVPRTVSPTRRVPLGAARPAGLVAGDDLEPAPSAAGRTLAQALGNPAGLRNAVVLAEVLAPPVALR